MLNKIIFSDKINIDKLYEKFCEVYLDKEKRPKFNGKFIYIEFNKLIENKSEDFWHMISLSEEDVTGFNILPCNNDESYGYCKDNCIKKIQWMQLYGKKRYICLYRAVRLSWLSDIIRLAGRSDSSITTWDELDNKKIKTYIRYKRKEIDYVVVLRNIYSDKGKLKYYKFCSAFPVFYISHKVRFSKKHREYIKQKKGTSQ